MALRIRLRRMGRKKSPHYRIVVAEASMPRDGRFVETLGHYNPRTSPKTLVVDQAKALEWVRKGAKPTETVESLFKQAGVYDAPAPGALDAVRSVASQAADTASRAASAVAGAVASAAATVRDAVVATGETVSETVTSTATDAGDAVIDTASAAGTAVADTTSDTQDTVTDAAGAVADAADEPVRDAAAEATGQATEGDDAPAATEPVAEGEERQA